MNEMGMIQIVWVKCLAKGYRSGLTPYWVLAGLLMLVSCRQGTIRWTAHLPDSGTYSSPRAVDLTGDGIKDIVLGAGGDREWAASPWGVLAFDGSNGELLWNVPCRNQIVGSPVFMSIDEDEIADIIIGGRSAQLLAVSGRDGRVIWEFLPDDPDADYRYDTTMLNFFTPQLIPDLDSDGREEILTAYGGYVTAGAGDPDRPPGYLLVISSATGKELHRAAMPDGRETYLSPVLLRTANGTMVLFGTGGETIPGRLYLTPLTDLLDNTINEAIVLAAGQDKGFIAPPVLTDLTGDRQADIIVNAYEGRTLAIDGAGYEMLWEIAAGIGFETHSQPAVGYFDDDKVPDFFVHFSRGQWPESDGARQLLISGKTGSFRLVDSIGSLQMSSPVTISGDPYDRVVLAANERIPTGHPLESGRPQYAYRSKVVLFDPAGGALSIWEERDGINLGSTLLIEDLDGDGTPEWVYCFNRNPYDIDNFGGIRIECAPLPVAARLRPWNQYMGDGHNAVFTDH